MSAMTRMRHVSPVAVALGACVVAGVALRAIALVAWWPVTPKLGDPGFYSYYAETSPLANPLHPDGYSLFLGAVTLLTRSVEVVVIAQHAIGVAAALVLFAAVRRLCGSPWPALVAAATVLLGADQAFLEHTIMSETLFVLLLSLTAYAVARMLEAPLRWWPWPVATGALVAIAGMTRVAGLFLVPVIALAAVLAGRRLSASWRPVAALAGAAGVLLVAYAGANAISHGHFHVVPTPGYHLYGRVAPFADCKEFEPPRGTRPLCERTAPADRLEPNFYLFGWDSPALRLVGREPLAGLLDPSRRDVTTAVVATFGRRIHEHDDLLGAFGRQAALHHRGAYALAVWRDVRAYFLPHAFDRPSGSRFDLSPALDWGATDPLTQRLTETGMEMLFTPFSDSRDERLLARLHDYQAVFRFGATPLTLATLLILVGLFVGPRRNRIAVLVLGGGGLAMLVLPTLSIPYVARYTVPLAGLMTGGAAVAVMSVTGRARSAWTRRRKMTRRARGGVAA